MKKVIVVLLVMIGGANMLEAADLDVVIDALVRVESSGNANAIGDNGTAWGCLQIRQCCLDDVNRFEAIHAKNEHRKARVFTKKDCFNVKTSKEIAKIYLTYWCKNYEKTIGKKANARVISLIWNAGPYKAKKLAITQSYWERTAAALTALGYKRLTIV